MAEERKIQFKLLNNEKETVSRKVVIYTFGDLERGEFTGRGIGFLELFVNVLKLENGTTVPFYIKTDK